MLSDLIFGLSLSIGAITLIGTQTYTPTSIFYRIVSFIFNFTIIIMIWVRYTGTMTILPVETGQVIFLNLLMLLLVGLEPYLLSIIQASMFIPDQTGQLPLLSTTATPYSSTPDYSTALYALVLAGLVGIQGFFTHILSREEKGLVPASFLKKYRVARNVQFLLAMLFIISALPPFWGSTTLGLPLRLQVWWIPLLGSVFLIVGKYGLGGLQHESSVNLAA